MLRKIGANLLIYFRSSVKNILLLFLLFVFCYPANALAYVGPGAGITALGALWGVVLAILFALGGFLAWPIRAFLRRRKRAKINQTQSAAKEFASESDAREIRE